MPDYPRWIPQPITSTTRCTPDWGNEVQDTLKSAIQDFYLAKQGATTLKSFFRRTLTTTGFIKAGAISHNELAGVDPDQHHSRLHGDKHINDDPIPAATITNRGLATPAMLAKMNTIATYATRKQMRASTYVGTGATMFINLGFQPVYILIFREKLATFSVTQFEFLRNATHCFIHVGRYASSAATHHIRRVASTLAVFTTNGFRVRSSCAMGGKKFAFFAIRETM